MNFFQMCQSFQRRWRRCSIKLGFCFMLPDYCSVFLAEVAANKVTEDLLVLSASSFREVTIVLVWYYYTSMGPGYSGIVRNSKVCLNRFVMNSRHFVDTWVQSIGAFWLQKVPTWAVQVWSASWWSVSIKPFRWKCVVWISSKCLSFYQCGVMGVVETPDNMWISITV